MPNETAIDPGAFLRDQVAPRVARRIEDLRAEIDRLHRELADRMTAEATVALVLEGPDGGTWYLNLHDGRMAVEAEAAQPRWYPSIRPAPIGRRWRGPPAARPRWART
jgi:hypothetical protein